MNKSQEMIAIDALNRRLVDAYRAKDIDAILSAYAAETGLIVFDLMPPSRYVGVEAFRNVFENYFKAFPGPVVIEAGDLSVEVCGTLGYSHKIDRWTIPGKNGAKAEVPLRFTTIYRKYNGQWLIVHEHNSVPIDPLTGESVLSQK